ncbi:MAG: transcriptional repressor [Nitrospirae bacterium]|nr:transcriptional repressor [Nitrospirota bacterium]MDA8215904.1 transcriptional repressor [Nitrospiraceae bacterium]
MEKQKFREFLTTKRLKLTKERNEILDEILDMKKHFDPEELFVRLKTKGSKVSRASVYRTIPLLIESGLLEEVERIDRHAHYERVSEDRHHDHMICIKCGKVIEFYSPTLEMLQDEICQKEKFKGIRHTLEILGYCEKCG